jgi:MFS transporter, OPA family, glycerol-3-phosphate transporter
MPRSEPEIGAFTRAPNRRLRRMQWSVLLATMFCYLFFYTGRQTFGFAIPGIQAELGVNKETLGWASTAMLWSYAIGQAINGNLADKFGGRRIMTVGALASTVVNWVVSLGTSVAGIAVPWGVNGYFQAMGWAAGGRVLSNWWPSSERGKTYGFYVFAAGTGSVVAYATSVLVLDVWGLDWRWIFRIPVLLMLVGGITFFLVARNRPEERGLPAPNEPATELAEPEPAMSAGQPADEGSRARYLAVLRHPKIWVTGISIGFQNAARYGLLVWVPVHFLGTNWEKGQATGGVSPLWVSVALPVGMAIGALTNGQISDRLFGSRRSQPIAVFMLLGAVCAVGMYMIPVTSAALAVCVLFLTGFFVYGPQASFWALCPDLVGTARSGTATGVVNFFAYLFAGFGEPLVGHLIDISGRTDLVFLIVAICCVASALFAAVIRR